MTFAYDISIGISLQISHTNKKKFNCKMLYGILIGVISISICIILGIKYHDRKSIQNRKRVRKHRNKKKLKLIHENKVRARIFALKQKTNDEENPKFESESELDRPNIDDDLKFVDNLRYWVINNRISAKAMNELLATLRSSGFHFLPKDSRTIMQTPTKLGIKDLTNGRLWYNGVAKCLEIVNMNNILIHEFTLDWNFDGLPIFKSSNLQFWPMLASIQGRPLNDKILSLNSHRINAQKNECYLIEMPQLEPMIVGIWCGESKPKLNEYFEPLINELKEILLHGITIKSRQIAVRIGNVICDTPARAFVKGKL